MVKVYGSGKTHNRVPISQRPPPVKDPETSQRTQVSAASVLSQSPSSSSSPLSMGFSGRVISQDSGSSTAEKTQQAAEPIMPKEESKEPFDDSTPRPNAPPHSISSVESYDLAMLNELLEPAECQELFRHIADNLRLTDKQKLFAIRRQMQQEAKVFGLSYSSEVKDIIRYVNSAERKCQIASAESAFAEALIEELLERGHQVDDLQAEYKSIMTDFNNKLIPSEEEKAQRISNVITGWQHKNPDIVKKILTISLRVKNIKVIPQYIARFTNLKKLDLTNNNITDVSALTTLTNLKWLYLVNNNITDVSALEALVELKKLSLSNNNITDVSALEALVKLKGLGLSNNNITDVSTLEALIKLETLDLSNNNITDVSALKTLVNLKWLYLVNNNITDVSALKTLVELKWLYLSDNNITDVSALEALIKLEWLYLSHNKITDVSALRNLVDLEILNFWGNKITDVSALRNLKKLKHFKFDDNKSRCIIS